MNSNQSQKRITVRDIARRLKISHTTVSRALKEDRRISPALRLKVQQAAKVMGYRPDPMLAALSHYRRGLASTPINAELAWINHWAQPKKLRSFKEFDLYWRGASEEAEQCGFRLEEFILDEQLTPGRLEKILYARNIQGILLPPHGDFPPEWGSFNWGNFCAVRFGYSITNPPTHVVTSNQMADGLIAFEKMRELGYRRIGLASILMTTRFGAGYLYGQLRHHNLGQIRPLIFSSDQNEPENCRALKKWITRYQPDAILTDTRQMRGLLAKIGRKVPDDIGLAVFSVLDGDADAGIDQRSQEIGRAAVQMVISLINHNERGIPETCRELLIGGRWVNGSTLPPKK